MNTTIPAIDGHAHLSELKDLRREIDEAAGVLFRNTTDFYGISFDR